MSLLASCYWRASTKLKIEILTDNSCLARSICHLTHLHSHQPGTQSPVSDVSRYCITELSTVTAHDYLKSVEEFMDLWHY